MKAQPKIKTETPTTYKIRIQMTAGRRATIEMTDQRQAKDLYDTLRNHMVFANEPIRLITFE